MKLHAGISGHMPKPKDQLQRRNKPPELTVLESIQTDVPAPSKTWARSIQKEWDLFWTSPLASLVNKDSDLSALNRLFAYKSELYTALKVYQKERVVEGSTKQPTTSPMFKVVTQLEHLIIPLEDRFGMSPAGRLRLGATLGEASKGLAEMNAAIEKEVASEFDNDEGDPRDFLDVASSDQGS